MSNLRLSAGLVAVLLLASACGDSSSGQTASVESTTTIAATTTGVAPVDGLECSASGSTAPATPSELDAAAAATFRAIADAAVACDVDELGRIAGDDITLSFGGHDDAAAFLADEDARSGELLRVLVQLLALEPGYQPDFGTWVWPAFWAGPDPASAADRTAIEEIYGVPFDEVMVAGVGYINHRVGIEADGDWSFFVAGD